MPWPPAPVPGIQSRADHTQGAEEKAYDRPDEAEGYGHDPHMQAASPPQADNSSMVPASMATPGRSL